MADTDPRLPVTLLTGFLGAGKTTLVNRILTRPDGEPTAVLVNEFGDVPIDGDLVVSADEEVVELANGCVCCTVRGDLVTSLEGLLARRRRRIRRRPFERLLIETSGLASPGPVVQTLLVEPALAAETRPAGVVTLTHAARVVTELEQHPEVAEQVGYADVLVLNHADRVTPEEEEAARAALVAVNGRARLHRTVRADVDAGGLLREAQSASDTAEATTAATISTRGGRVHGHTSGAATVVLRSERPLRLDPLKMWLTFLTTRRGHELWRLKGLLRCAGHAEPVVVQAVYQWLELGPGEGEPPAESRLVLIGRDLDAEELERGWRACLDS